MSNENLYWPDGPLCPKEIMDAEWDRLVRLSEKNGHPVPEHFRTTDACSTYLRNMEARIKSLKKEGESHEQT